MRRLTIREARVQLDALYPLDIDIDEDNIEDTLTSLSKWVEFRSMLDDIEIKFGIMKLETDIEVLNSAVYYIENTTIKTDDVINRLRSKIKEIQDIRGEKEKELDVLLDSVSVEEDFFNWR